MVSKWAKILKLADKSECGWMTVNEYLSDELASDLDDKKRIYCSKRCGEKRVRKKRHQRNLKRSSSYRAPSTSTQNVGRLIRGSDLVLR